MKIPSLFERRDVRETEVNVTLKTRFLSIPPAAFENIGDTQTHAMSTTKTTNTDVNSQNFFAPVYLPHGATITAAVVYGTDVSEYWTLSRIDHADGESSISALTVIGTEDASINHIVDNENYSYIIWVNPVVQNEVIYGARITYTTSVTEI